MTPDLRPFWRKRRYWVPLVVAAVTNAVVYGAGTHRLATKQERLTREQTALTESVASRQEELTGLAAEREQLARNDEAAERFWAEIVRERDPGLAEAIAEIDRLTAESRVSWDRTAFGYENLDVGLIQVQASIPLRGSYFDLIGFINRLERSSRFFLVNRLGLKRSSGRNADLELSCEIVFFLRANEDDGAEQS